MKRFVALLLLCIAFTMLPALADAEYIGNMEVVNCNEWVSLRESPSTSAKRLVKVSLGAIVSNCEQGYPQLCIEKLGIGAYIQDHLCFGDTGTSKGKTIRTLMAKNNIESAIYIGDTQGDYEATVEAGLPFIWCTYGFGTPEGCVAKVDAFEELLNLI